MVEWLCHFLCQPYGVWLYLRLKVWSKFRVPGIHFLPIKNSNTVISFYNPGLHFKFNDCHCLHQPLPFKVHFCLTIKLTVIKPGIHCHPNRDLTLVMLNNLRCHADFKFPASQITWSGFLIEIHIFNDKQCRSRSVGTDLDLHCFLRRGMSCLAWEGLNSVVLFCDRDLHSPMILPFFTCILTYRYL